MVLNPHMKRDSARRTRVPQPGSACPRSGALQSPAAAPDVLSDEWTMKSSPSKISFVARLALWMSFAAALPGCQSVTDVGSKPSREKSQRQLSDSQALVQRYEKRCGKLLPEKPRREFRALRAQLKGKPMSEVAALPGKPGGVYTSGASGSWDCTNIAYDSASGRTVQRLEVWFAKGVVDYITASF